MKFLNFSLWNINGYSKEKKQVIFACAESLKLNLIVLLETHNNTEFGFSSNWDKIVIPSKHKGIAILFKHALKIKIRVCKSRYIAFEATINDRIYSFLFVYGGHSKKHKSSSWWEKLDLSSFDFVAGDFNLVLENADRCSGTETAPLATRTFIADQLSDFDDLGLPARKFTYYIKGIPISRIDRIYIRKCFSHFLEKFEVLGTGRDHALLVCRLRFAKSNAKSWKFRSHIFDHKKYDDVINQTVHDIPVVDDWCCLKDEIIERVAKLQRTTFAKQQAKKFKLVDLVRKIPKKSAKYLKYKAKLNSICQKMEYQRKILKGVGDFKFKDLPSRLLTNLIKKNETDKNISFIVDEQNGPVYNQVEIRNEFSKFYSNLYSKNTFDVNALNNLLKCWVPDPLLNLSVLDEKITVKEAIAALKSCNPRKASGTDGLSFRILKNLPLPHLEVLVDNFNLWLDGKEIPSKLKEGVVVTIPKKDQDPHVISNRRPITLLNVDYKLLSKILTARLEKIMGKLIDIGQVGFMKDRLIFDNIIALNEILANKKNLVINLDFSKAYDSVNHEALIYTIRHLGFPPKFTALIQNMIVGSFSKVLVNDVLSPPFQIERGVKQGDVISPFLFNLVVEILQKNAIFSKTPLSPPTVGDCPVHMLLYADDVVIPTTNMLGINNWMKILDDFAKATGLFLNKQKSSIIYNGTRTLPLPLSRQTGCFNFLGIKFNCSGICSKNPDLLTKIENSFRSYFRPSHNIFARVSVAKCYVLPKLWHHAFLITLPNAKIEKLITKFLWSSKSLDIKGRTCVSKTRMRKPRKYGGLAMWEMSSRNDAFLASSLERIMFNHSKCSRMWQSHLSTKKLFKFYAAFSQNPSIPLNPTTSKLFNKFLNCWLKTIPKNINNFSDFLQEIMLYRDIKKLEKNINLNKDMKWEEPLWTPRQLSLARTCNVTSIFRNLGKIPQRSHAVFLWKFMQGGLPFSHDQTCSLSRCKLSYEHIFFSCIFTLYPVKMILKIIKLMVRVPDFDNQPVTIKPLWNQSFILYHLGSLSPSSLYFHLIVSGLITIWKLFNKRIRGEWFDVVPSLIHEICSNMSAMYNDIKENSFTSYTNYTDAKDNFLLAWRVPVLFNKFGNTFAPKQCLLEILD